MTLSFFDLLYHQPSATIRHFSYADLPARTAPTSRSWCGLVASGLLHPGDRSRHRLGDTAGTLADLRDRRIGGNAVLTVN